MTTQDDARKSGFEISVGGVMAVLLGIGSVLYVLAAAGCAVYLVLQMHGGQNNGTLDDFSKVAIGALIAVVGSGLTGLAAVYGATRQSATAAQVAKYGGNISTDLAAMREEFDASLAAFKAASEESLTRLKIALDAGQNANRELFGAIANYFYALRSSTRAEWDEEYLETAERAMIASTRHLLHVDKPLRDQWFDVWQRLESIHHEAVQESNVTKRQELADTLFGKKFAVGDKKLDVRDLYNQLETKFTEATKAHEARTEIRIT